MDYTSKKVVFFGDPSSGKSCLLISTFYNNFNHKRTYPSEWQYTTVVNGKQVRLILHDPNRQHSLLFPAYLADCDMVVLCFSINEPESLKNVVEFWAPLIRQNRPEVPIVLVANKCDLRSDPQTILKLSNKNCRPISYKDGQNVSVRIGACCHYECSDMTKTNIQELMQSIAVMVMINSSSEPKKKKRTCWIS